ncbi:MULTISPECIES: helix-turn-helix domain-containing protein [Mycolicibacterium]|uniref:helix-turn-helix domain-containing protein n=1 Tax=Mycolicibacterium monacense TaxID=85693 RepID=UPI0007EB3562|nr:helix-turn-helix transcriptional regulator [Mycolicibacterium monacense]OBB58425.1 transcriptional regulator [Mycolicibacterium monacense]
MASERLGEFLRARRAQVNPEDVGLQHYGERRRVAGLRREELAQLAGVSVSYYTRLEQGQSVNASAAILDSLARALQLNEYERQHLRDLATRRTEPVRRPPAERVSTLTRDLLLSLGDLPAVVVGRRTDVLAWNDVGHALVAGHIDREAVERATERPNLARMMFLDPHTRELYLDWPRKARAVVGNLRHVAGRHPEDALLSALIGELTVKSPEFVALWADHRVKRCEADTYDLHHPLVGPLTVTQQNLTLARSPEQALSVMTTAEGSASADTMQLLIRSVRGDHPAPQRV